jgi:hypothetical protein
LHPAAASPYISVRPERSAAGHILREDETIRLTENTTMNMTTFTTGARAALVALSLGASMLAPLSAVAAPPMGPGPSLTLGGPNGAVNIGPGGIKLKFGTPDYFKKCLSDNGVLRLLAKNGFHFVKIVRSSNDDNGRNRVWATGVKNFDYYMIRVDRCDRSFSTHKLGHNNKNNFSGFSLNFNF